MRSESAAIAFVTHVFSIAQSQRNATTKPNAQKFRDHLITVGYGVYFLPRGFIQRYA